MRLRFKELLLKPEIVFLIIASVFGLMSLFLMPALETPDENQHFQVSYGVFSSAKQDKSGNLELGKDLQLSETTVLEAIEKGAYDDYFTNISSASRDGFAINTDAYAFGGYAEVSVFDITHLPQALGVLIGRIIYPTVGFMVIMGRLFNLALFIAALYFIIKKVRYGKWVFVMIACLPIMIQQMASLSHDVLNVVAIFAWFAYMINLVTQTQKISKKQILLGVCIAVLLFWTKYNNLLLLALLAALPPKQITGSKAYQTVRSNRYWSIIKPVSLLSITVASCLLFYVMWGRLLAGHEFYAHRLAAVLLNTYVWGDLTLIDAVMNGVVGSFSNFYYHIPFWAVVMTFMVLTVVLLSEKIPKITLRFAVVSGLLFLGSILLISVGMYYAWAMLPRRLGAEAMVTDGIQGRYFTPLLILLFPVFAYLQRYAKITVNSKYVIPVLASSTSIFLLSFYIVQTLRFFWI